VIFVRDRGRRMGPRTDSPGLGLVLLIIGRVAEGLELASVKGQAPSEVVAAVTSEVHQFAATRLADDLCVVAARIAEG
jgi:hypothetical protein